MKPIFFLLSLATSLSLNCFSQNSSDQSDNLSEETKAVVADIEKTNQVTDGITFAPGDNPTQSRDFPQLKKVASQKEINALLTHPNPVVRCFAFWVIYNDTTTNLLPLVIAHIDDTAMVKISFGSTKYWQRVGDFFADRLPGASGSALETEQNKKDHLQFDSILLFRPNHLAAKTSAIQRAILTKANYNRIKELAVTEQNGVAFVKLAEYREKKDIPLILKYAMASTTRDGGNFCGFMAIANFPDASLFPFLKDKFQNASDAVYNSSQWLQLYRAIAAYRNDEAAGLLSESLIRFKDFPIRENHINYIFTAAKEFRAPAFDKIFWNLWEKDFRTDPEIFTALRKTDSLKAFILARNCLKKPNETDEANLASETLFEENIISGMLKWVLNKDTLEAIRIIADDIKIADVHLFPVFSAYAVLLKRAAFREPLLSRVESDANPYVFLAATKALLSFNDDKINQRLQAAPGVNNNLRNGWGGLRFAELVKQAGSTSK